jgi:hypothetical protein
MSEEKDVEVQVAIERWTPEVWSRDLPDGTGRQYRVVGDHRVYTLCAGQEMSVTFRVVNE